MNENIKLLAEKAGFIFWNEEEWKPEGADIDWATDYTKEFNTFVELLVAVCALEAMAGQLEGKSNIGANILEKFGTIPKTDTF